MVPKATAAAKPMSLWWGVLLLAVAGAGWWLQPARTDTGRTGLVERILFPLETNALAPDGSLVIAPGATLALSNDGRVARVALARSVLRSDTLGTIWYREAIPDRDSHNRLRAVAQSANGRRVIAVGSKGRIVTTIDDGATWTERASGVDWDLDGVAMSADGMRANARPAREKRVLRSVDGGITWTIHPAPAAPFGALTLTADGSIGLIAGSDGLWRTTDGGATWSDVTAQLGADARVAHAAIAADGRGAMAVLERVIVRSTDGGSHLDRPLAQGRRFAGVAYRAVRGWRARHHQRPGHPDVDRFRRHLAARGRRCALPDRRVLRRRQQGRPRARRRRRALDRRGNDVAGDGRGGKAAGRVDRGGSGRRDRARAGVGLAAVAACVPRSAGPGHPDGNARHSGKTHPVGLGAAAVRGRRRGLLAATGGARNRHDGSGRPLPAAHQDGRLAS
jgi:hypothetical protein